MDDRGTTREGVRFAGDTVIEAGAESDDDIGTLEGADGGHSAVHARHSQIERVIRGHDVERRERRHEGGADDVDQLGELTGWNPRTVQSAAEIEHWPFCSTNDLGGLSDTTLIRFSRRGIAAQIDLARPPELDHALLSVLGDVDQNGARATSCGYVEGLGHTHGNLLGRGDEERVLDERHRRTDDVGLLEGIGANRFDAHLTGDRHKRYRIHVGIGNGSNQVCGSGTRGDHTHARFTGDHGIPLSSMPGTLLMAHEHMANLLAGEQRVVEGQNGPTGHAEYVGDADLLQRSYKCLSACHQPAVLRLLGRGSVAARHPPTSSLCDLYDRNRPCGQLSPNRRWSQDTSRMTGGTVPHRGITDWVRSPLQRLTRLRAGRTRDDRCRS